MKITHYTLKTIRVKTDNGVITLNRVKNDNDIKKSVYASTLKNGKIYGCIVLGGTRSMIREYTSVEHLLHATKRI